ncbi:MAG: hypothetical protein PHR25_01705 [Clostridia bacterium]|nr:hypothetical protein [Clostridia bacterium]MDD4375477.1 hypothetical protein [Clostridia bacterium]
MTNIINLTQASKIKSTIRFIDKNYEELCIGLENLKRFVVSIGEYTKAYSSQSMVFMEMQNCFPKDQEIVKKFFCNIESISIYAIFEVLQGKTYEDILNIIRIEDRYERIDIAWKTIANLNYLIYEIKRLNEKQTMEEKQKILEGMLVYV